MNLFWDFFTYIYRMFIPPIDNDDNNEINYCELKECELKECELKDAKYTFVFLRE